MDTYIFFNFINFLTENINDFVSISFAITITLGIIITPFYLFWVYTYHTKKAKEQRKNKGGMENYKRKF